VREQASGVMKIAWRVASLPSFPGRTARRSRSSVASSKGRERMRRSVDPADVRGAGARGPAGGSRARASPRSAERPGSRRPCGGVDPVVLERRVPQIVARFSRADPDRIELGPELLHVRSVEGKRMTRQARELRANPRSAAGSPSMTFPRSSLVETRAELVVTLVTDGSFTELALVIRCDSAAGCWRGGGDARSPRRRETCLLRPAPLAATVSCSRRFGGRAEASPVPCG